MYNVMLMKIYTPFFRSYVLAQILSSQARESIVENIHDYLTSGMVAHDCVKFHTYHGSAFAPSLMQ